jgi:hypothetical protein
MWPPPECKLSLEVHFHEQFEATVGLEGSIPLSMRQGAELMLFSNFMMRQLFYLGQSEAVASALAFFHRYSELQAEVDEEFTETGRVMDIRVDSHRGAEAKKRFLNTLTWDGGDQWSRSAGQRTGLFFTNKAKGFGFFGKGLDYYACAAPVVLFWNLKQRRLGETDFASALERVAELCALKLAQGRVGHTTISAEAIEAAHEGFHAHLKG